ncbi:MAG: glycosyltransferase family 4 protein [Actinobacteria bacterium]|nr:glycosyltransferase family 4 protein [Actinomycetota bacterium]
MVKLKILILSDYAYIEGGTGRVAISSAIKLAEKGHEVVYFSGVGPITEDLTKAPFKEVICLGQKDILNNPSTLDAIFSGIYNWRAIGKLKLLFKKWIPDIAQVHGLSKALSWSVIDTLYKYKVPVIFTLHDFGLICPNLGIYNFRLGNLCEFYKPGKGLKCLATNCDKRIYIHKLWRWIRYHFSIDILRINRKVSSFIAVSEFMYEFFKDYIPKDKPIKVIHNPIDNQVLKLKDDLKTNKYKDFSFLYLGRLSLEKGVDMLLGAIKNVNAKLVIVGDGEMYHYCKDRIREIGNEKIRLLGWQKEGAIANEMKHCNAIILPSRVMESAGMVILEAARYSLPAIVSNHGVLRKLVEDKVNGLLFEPDNVESLIDAMKKAINNPDLVEFMSKKAINIFKKFDFSINSHIDKLEKFYKDTIDISKSNIR